MKHAPERRLPLCFSVLASNRFARVICYYFPKNLSKSSYRIDSKASTLKGRLCLLIRRGDICFPPMKKKARISSSRRITLSFVRAMV